jgi:hypothetical protein
MQNKLFLSASVAALFAATSANATVSGSLDVSMSYGAETDGMHSTFFLANGAGRLEFGLMDDWNGQLEVFGSQSTNGTNTWYGKYSDNLGLSTGGAALHMNTTMDDVTFGPFVMLESTTVGDRGFATGCCGGGYNSGQNIYAEIGGEARWHWMPDFDINAELGGLFDLAPPGSHSSSSGSLNNAFFAGGGATWFIDNDNAISGHFDWIGGEGGSAFYIYPTGAHIRGQTGWNYGASFSHQFEDCPFAAYVGYEGDSFAWGGYVQHENVFSVGLKWFFNGDTLRSQHDSAGFSAPHFERMINQSDSADDVSY